MAGATHAVLHVTRTLPEDVGHRQVIVQLDGVRVAALRHGQSWEQPVPAGGHRLRADNTLFSKTVEFEARPGERVEFVVANRAGFGSWLLSLLGGGPMFLSVERRR